MQNWIVRYRIVWSFKRVYPQNAFTNHRFNIHAKTRFGIKEPTVVDKL